MGYHFSFVGGGELNLWEEGSRVFFRVELPDDGETIYKVWIGGRAGHEMLLGTPTSQGGMLRLFRTISRTQLEYADCWPVQSARKQKFAVQHSEKNRWYCEMKPEELVPLLKERMERVGPMLCRKRGNEVWIAAPFSSGKPIVLSELFCFAVPQKINGSLHLIWYFDREGKPNLQ